MNLLLALALGLSPPTRSALAQAIGAPPDALTVPPAEPIAADGDPSTWADLSANMARELDLTADILPADRWRQETAGLLRDDPSLPLPAAMAEAAARVASLGAEAKQRIEQFLSGKPLRLTDRPVTFAKNVAGTRFVQVWTTLYEEKKGRLDPLLDQVSPIADSVEFRGSFYFSGASLLSLEGRTFRTVSEVGGKSTQLEADGDAIYAVTEKAVFRSSDGREWRAIFKPKHGTVNRIALSEGRLFVATTEGFYSNESGEWKTDLEGRTMRDVLVQGDRLYAAARHGVYSRPLSGGKLQAEQPGMGSDSRRLLSADGRMFLTTNLAAIPLFEKVGGDWEPVTEPVGRVHFIEKAGSDTYFGTNRGIFVRRGEEWKPIAGYEDEAEALLAAGEKIYVGGGGGLLRLNPPNLPTAWQEAAVRELESALGPDAASRLRETLKSDGAAIEKGGRTLFSALKRLASTSLGFGEAPAEQPPPSPWVAVFRRLSAEFGLLNDEGGVEAFKAAVIEEFRNQPGLQIDLAMLKAFAKSGRVSAEDFDRLHSLASGVPQRILSGLGGVNSLRAIDGRPYAATDKGLFERQGGEWKAVIDGKEIFDAAKVGGVMYAAAQEGVLADEGGWKLTLKAQAPYNLSDLDGRPLASSSSGQRVRGWGGFWRPYWPGIGFVHRIVEVGGRLYANTSEGLLEKRWWGWKTILDNQRHLIGSVRDVASFEGRLYAATEWGVLRRDGSLWETIYHEKEMNTLGVIGGKLYVGAKDGLHVMEGASWPRVFGTMMYDIVPIGSGAYLRTNDAVYEWRPTVRFVADGELPELLADIGKALAAPGRNSEPPKEDRLVDSGTGVEKRGRTIFSGMAANASRPAPQPIPVWVKLSAKLAGRLGLSAGSIAPDSLEAETRRLLRDRPDLSLDELALQAAAKAGRAPSGSVDALRGKLAGELRLSLSNLCAIEAVRWIDGRAWAAGENGLFVLTDGVWRKAGDLPGLHDIAKIGGRWYRASKHGVDVMTSDGEPNPASTWKYDQKGGPAYRIVELDGRPLVERVSDIRVHEASFRWLGMWFKHYRNFTSIKRSFVSGGRDYIVANALYRRGRFFWWKVKLPGAPYVSDAVEKDGMIYAAASNGVWRISEGALPELVSAKPVRCLALAYGKLLAGDQDGFYSLESDGWRPILSRQYFHLDQIEPAGEGAWLLRTIWGAYLWRPKRSLLDADDSNELAAELSTPSRPDSPLDSAQAEPLSSDGQSVLKGSRSIFRPR